MISLEIDCLPEARDLLIADLWELGCRGIVELTESRVRAFFDDDAGLAGLLARFPGTAIRQEEDRDWVQAARDLLPPMEVGDRFYLVPEWRDDPAPPGRFRIAVNPGMAFGTGVHETTRLCIESLERFVQPGMAVLDVGTGSGILAQAARLLGADPIAIEIARQGFIGSVDAVRDASVDLVVANISPEAIIRLAPDLIRVLRPGGMLLASGLELAEIGQVQAALPEPDEIHQMGNWALVAKRRR